MRDRPARWLLPVVALNSVASVAAIALWAFAPCRGVAARCPPAAKGAEAARPPIAAQASPQWRPPVPLAPQRAAGPTGEVPQTSLRQGPAQMPTKRSAKQASAATSALASRLQLNPEVIAEQLCDEDGELPKQSAARLERGFDAGQSIAKRVGADESRTQSLVALVTYYAFSVLAEERKAAPNAPDPARIEELQSALVDDVRTTCGEAAAALVKDELTSL